MGDYIIWEGATYYIEKKTVSNYVLRKKENPHEIRFISLNHNYFKKSPHTINGQYFFDLAVHKLNKSLNLEPFLIKSEDLKEIDDTEKNHFILQQLINDICYNDMKKYGSIQSSKIHILPHQINAVYQILYSLNHRFLIADEVGLGKTIETGLIIKEFTIRYQYKKILIITPATLTSQWQQELSEKFNEQFIILDRKTLIKNKNNLDQIIQKKSHIIVSLDFAKQEDIKNRLIKHMWDIIVFDEAHRLNRNRSHATLSYSFADQIVYQTKCLLLLSATPFSGKLEELYYLVRLICREKIGDLNSFLQSYDNHGTHYLESILKDVTIRRTKKQVGGFTKRNAITIQYCLNDLEQDYYNTLSSFIKNEYRKAVEQKSNHKALMLIFFQKIMDSSIEAAQKTIKKRIEHLKNELSTNSKNITEKKEEYFLKFFEKKQMKLLKKVTRQIQRNLITIL